MLFLKIYLLGVLVYFLLLCFIDIKMDDEVSLSNILWNLFVSLPSWFTPVIFIIALFFVNDSDLE